MPDLVVTVPKDFWFEWINEGDAVGEPATGTEWGFWLGRNEPPIERGDRLYIVAHGRLRGYSPVTRVAQDAEGRWVVCREGGGVACTIPEPIRGFQGFRHRWWPRATEKPFICWKTDGVKNKVIAKAMKQGHFQWPDGPIEI